MAIPVLENNYNGRGHASYARDSVVVPVSSGSSSSGGSSSSLQRIIDSGVPITGGNSASYVDQNAASLSAMSDITANFDKLFDLIQKNTNYNNAWSAEQAQKQMDFQTQSNQIAMDFNAAEAAKNRDWQQMMSNTAHQREIQDLKAAGLNPVLSVTGGNGAPVTSGSAASGVTSGGAMADADQSGNTALASIYGALINAQTNMYNANLSARTNLQMAEISKEAALAGASLAAQAAMYGADSSRAAQAYSADLNFTNNQLQREFNIKYPQTYGGIISSAKNEADQARSGVRDKINSYLDKYLDVPPWLAKMFS